MLSLVMICLIFGISHQIFWSMTICPLAIYILNFFKLLQSVPFCNFFLHLRMLIWKIYFRILDGFEIFFLIKHGIFHRYIRHMWTFHNQLNRDLSKMGHISND